MVLTERCSSCCPHHGAPLQRLSTEIPRQESERRGGWNIFEKLLWEACDERSFQSTKGFSSPVLLLSVTLQDLSGTHTPLPVSHFSFELWTKTGVVADFMYNTACLSRPVFTIFTLFLEKSAISAVCTKLQQIPRQPFNIKRCEKWWKEKENK